MKSKLQIAGIVVIIFLGIYALGTILQLTDRLSGFDKIIIALFIFAVFMWFVLIGPLIQKDKNDRSYRSGYNKGLEEGHEKGYLDGRLSNNTLSSSEYDKGYQDGKMAERTLNEREWRQFFNIAQLKNTITGAPINTPQDFYKWKNDFESANAKRENTQRANNPPEQSYLIETSDGFLVDVPESKLEEWEKAQENKELSPGLQKHQQYIIDRVKRTIYGGKN